MGIAELKREMGRDAPEWREGERSETSWNGGASLPGAATPSRPGPAIPDPEIGSKAVRRKFTAAYKRRILQEADKGDPGAIAGLLRREGLYSSHLTTWRRQRESGEIAGLEPRKRGKKPVPKNPLRVEVQQLTRENQRLQKRLKQAEMIIDVQKKLCEMLGLPVATTEVSGSDE
jgi:transposase